MAVVVTVQPTSLEEISTPLYVSGVSRAVVESYTVQVAVLLWDATAPIPPSPDGGTTWHPAFWDTDADQLTAVFRVGPGTDVGLLTPNARYRVYLRITGGSQQTIEDIGTLLCGTTASYSGSPTTSTRDAVRFEIGDTSEPFELTDAEVDYALANNATSPRPALAAAADLAYSLATRYAREFESETDGDQSVTKGKRWASMLQLADKLSERAAGGDAGTVGLSGFFADPELGDETGRGKPQFALGQHDNHQAAAT